MRRCTALRHVPFEDLAAFVPPLVDAGYGIEYVEAATGDLSGVGDPELLVVLGGPIGAYEDDAYPFLAEELRLIEARLAAERPLMGICLGAQLIARAAGARVYPSGHKEIGFKPITLTEAGRVSCLAPFAEDGMTLHWHGDTFDLPEGAALLASTDLCENQAFSMGPNVVAFQFHPEAGTSLEPWLVGHACELAGAKIDVPQLRADAQRHGAALAAKARTTATAWLAGLTG